MKARGDFIGRKGPGGVYTVQPEIIPESVEWKNIHGETIKPDVLKFRCKGCGIGCTTVAIPGTPREAPYRCRRCDYVTMVKTRESAMDEIEGIWEERGHMKNLMGRRTNSRGAGQRPSPGLVPQVVRGKLVYLPKAIPNDP